jgi:PAS domain S-box-containing protein
MKSEETIIELFGSMPYKPLVEEIKDYAICHLDIEGRILSWNQGAQLIFGYGKDEIIGQHSSILSPRKTARNTHRSRNCQQLKKRVERKTRAGICEKTTRSFSLMELLRHS